jgi:hypothetical protein
LGGSAACGRPGARPALRRPLAARQPRCSGLGCRGRCGSGRGLGGRSRRLAASSAAAARGGFGGGLGRGFGGFARQALLLLALRGAARPAPLPAGGWLGLGARFFLAALQFEFFGLRPPRLVDRRGASSRLTKTRFLRTSTWMVRALPLASACLISLVDLRVSVIFLRSPAAEVPCACAGTRAGAPCRPRSARRRATSWHAGRLQLLEQRRRRAIELGGELGDGGHGHGSGFPWVLVAVAWAVGRGRLAIRR